MLKKIYTELVQIRKELQTIRKLLEPKTVYLKGKPINTLIIQKEYGEEPKKRWKIDIYSKQREPITENG